MRATSFAFRLWAAGFAFTSMTNCAEGGLDDAGDDGDVEQDQGGSKGSDGGSTKDAGKDARTSTGGGGGDDDDNTPVTSKDAGTTTGTKDSGTGTGGGTKDSGTGTTPPATAIKCPSPLICTDQISLILSAFAPNVMATDKLCANSGQLLPSGVSCTTDDACRGARLTTATCQGGYCIQPCTQ